MRRATGVISGLRFERRDPCPVPAYRRLYRDVGAQWYWHDRLEWPDAQLAEYLAQPEVAVWEAMLGTASAGYFELKRHDDRGVEVVYFGLVAGFIGRGLGGAMLTRAIDEAWTMGAMRVWLHTCTLDSPNALPAYKARGLRAFRTERFEAEFDGLRLVSERPLP